MKVSRAAARLDRLVTFHEHEALRIYFDDEVRGEFLAVAERTLHGEMMFHARPLFAGVPQGRAVLELCRLSSRKVATSKGASPAPGGTMGNIWPSSLFRAPRSPLSTGGQGGQSQRASTHMQRGVEIVQPVSPT